MNIADIIVILILGVCFYVYYKKGLILTLFGFCSTLLSAVLSRFLSPLFGDVLRQTAVFDSIREYVSSTILKSGTGSGNNFINSLEIPEFLKTALLDNNNQAVYKKLNVTQITDYVSEYVASFIVNIIAMISVFIVLLILFKFLSKTLNLIAKLPVIKTANKLAGGGIGIVQGVLIIWIALAILTMFYGKPMFNSANEMISNSLIAVKFYDSNILIKGLSAINNLF